MKKIIALSILALGFTTYANAQATASADASATIIAPIDISMAANMDFGNVAVNASNGTVLLDPITGTRTAGGGVTLPASAGTVSLAKFDVTGEAGFTYDITLPASAITLEDATNTYSMTVDNFTSNPGTSGILTAGYQLLKVGATLNVNGSQAPGVYTSTAPFDVTVNYN